MFVHQKDTQLPCTYPEQVRDGAANFTFSFHGQITFDLSTKVDLRWLDLSGRMKVHSERSELCVFSAHVWIFLP